jgi:F0F1-type ATP synthase assembly protein I
MAIYPMNHPAVIVFLIQAAITVGVSVIGYVILSPLHALSVIVGGSVAIIPQSLFGFWVFRQRGARNARAIAKNLFVGEGLKLSMTAALFALVWINSGPLETVAVLAGFVLTVLVGQLSLPLILGGTRTH